MKEKEPMFCVFSFLLIIFHSFAIFMGEIGLKISGSGDLKLDSLAQLLAPIKYASRFLFFFCLKTYMSSNKKKKLVGGKVTCRQTLVKKLGELSRMQRESHYT